MFKKEDYVVHSGHGLCQVLDLVHNDSLNKDFYKLQTMHNHMTIMMPSDNASAYLRPILTKDSLVKIMNQSYMISNEYIKDNKERKVAFQLLITSNDIQDTIKLLKMLYHLLEDKRHEKKTLGSFDTQFLQQAERKLLNELSIGLNISKEEALALMYERLKVQHVY